jgi:UDP-N-acetylmuramoyl-L-alanyl-D-glutamate--2,6-diaminopimelate ligase
MTDLGELITRLGGTCSTLGTGADGPVVTDVFLDSRRVRPGGLFAALPGTQDNGARHVADAVSRGAVVVLSPHEQDLRAVNPSTPGAGPKHQIHHWIHHWIHPDPRRAAGQAAALVHGEPARGLRLCAITGTNGKTTTAHVLGHLLNVADMAPAVLGTAGHRLAGGRALDAGHTTPDAPELQRLLRLHADGGGSSVVMEVSSHALDQERTAGLDFDVALFTNLTREHLDYHGDMHRYGQAKARLFASLRPGATAVLNLDDDAWRVMAHAAESVGARVITYSARRQADLTASRLRTDSAGSRFNLDGMGISTTELRLPLRGRYNVENALAAAAAARLMGASPSTVVEGIATTSAAPGRLEPVHTGRRGFSLFVDYAHSPDALERVLRTLRVDLEEAGSGGRLIVVFGCGGDRDAGKRPEMGRVASELADVAIVTSDNPRGEAPERIIRDILAGMGAELESQRPEAQRVVEVDRRRAIARAVALAGEGDVLLLAGKGHEAGQTVGAEVLPFDDRLVAQEALV